MPLFTLNENGLTPISRTDFATARVRERQDLQRVLRDQIEALDSNLFLLSEEFGRWEEGKRRIDLLAIDKSANLVVIELKRTQDGGLMDLQAIRYAALIANMTFEQAVRTHKEYLEIRGIEENAEQRILAFLGWEQAEQEEFGTDVRILLVSGDFSRELTTSVLWLNEKGLDIRCVRLRPYQLEDRLVLQVEQVLPLPEAQEYMIGVREKQRSEASARNRDFTKFDLEIDGEKFEGLAKRQAIVRVATKLCAIGASPEELAELAGRTINDMWRYAEGHLTSDDLVQQLDIQADEGGPAFEPRRWFVEEEFLIYSDNQTWAFTKMWGLNTEEVMETWVQAFPQAQIKIGRSSQLGSFIET